MSERSLRLARDFLDGCRRQQRGGLWVFEDSYEPLARLINTERERQHRETAEEVIRRLVKMLELFDDGNWSFVARAIENDIRAVELVRDAPPPERKD